ncbi:hypothetical protein KC360_g4873 [Hortaea werneckii]|nr:hypothetical protein KC325_g4867 [Hortaea werneckii]KAI6992713.1 hypothetical protein KC359_g5554 [Hortaea werneckii]KAI7145117.1 hypothetical protein KC344_g4793 [Hortaea werneckii]KAI7173516.1 hypothetical protein KC360_g4873 [Hortaea werneckii]
MSALLYDRDERNALQRQQYSYDRECLARVPELSDGEFSFDVQIKGDNVALGEQKRITHVGNEITVYDFKVAVPNAGGIGKAAMQRLCRFETANVHVICENPAVLSHSGGKARGKFSLRNILLDQESDIWAPDLFDHLIDNYHSQTVPCEEARAATRSMPKICSLSEEQKAFFIAALDGPYANTIILEGVPGSDKTTSLSALVIALMRMGAKVLVCSQSNSDASALFDQVTNLIESHQDIRDLGDRCVRYRSNVVEELAMEHLESSLPPDPLRQYHQKYSMATHIHEYIEHYPGDPVVRDLKAHLQVRRLGKEPASRNSFGTVITLLQQRIMGDCLLVGATAFMSTNLDDLNYHAHVLIFDEASQATEPGLPMATATQLDLLVVLAGDLKQLGPVVPSHTNNRNTYGNILATSPLRRVKTAYPEVQRMMLHRNYRAHLSLIKMSSKLSYKGEMVAGCPDIAAWDTQLARRVRSWLSGPDLAAAFQNREKALAQDNRQFFLNVQSQPVREDNRSSWRNEGGVAAVVALAKRLTSTCNVSSSDIGIISMYREDCRYLKKQLKAVGLAAINVSEAQQTLKASTVDAFQGQQRRIMIVHFVAAFNCTIPGHNPFGFIKDQNRLNVATTRAREYQFLVGNMSHWWHWKTEIHVPDQHSTAYKKIFEMIDYKVQRGQGIESGMAENMLKNVIMDMVM